MLEFSYEWKFNKVWYFTPKLSGKVGHQWGDLSQGGSHYTYWNVALTLGFNKKPPLELDIRYWDTGDFTASPARPRACSHAMSVSWRLSKSW